MIILKVDEKSPYFTTFSCPYGRYRYVRVIFGAGQVGDMFQKKIDELLSGMSNVFSIADNILIRGFDQ